MRMSGRSASSSSSSSTLKSETTKSPQTNVGTLLSPLTSMSRFRSAYRFDTSRISTATPWVEKNAAACRHQGHPRLTYSIGLAFTPRV